MSEMDIKAQVSLYTQGYESGLAKIRSENQSFTSSLSGIAPMIAGAFSVGAIASFANSLMQNAHNLEATSKNLNVNVESLQALRAAAREANVEEGGLDTTLGRVIKAQEAALAGDLKQADYFNNLKISIQDLRDLAPDQIYARMGKAIVDSNEGAKEMDSVFKILGKTTASQLGLLKLLGSEGIDPLIAKYKALGLVIDDAYVKRLSEAEKTTMRFWERTKAFFSESLASLISGFGELGSIIVHGPSGKGPWERADEEASGKPYVHPAYSGKPVPRATPPPSPYELEYEKKMLEQWEKEGPALDRVAYYKKQIAEITAHMGTGDEEYRNKLKILALIEKQNTAQKQLNEEDKRTNDQEAKFFKREEEENKIRLDAKKEIAKLSAIHIAPLMTDSLAKMGGYVGGQVNPGMRVAEKTLLTAEQSLRITTEMNTKLNRLNDIYNAVEG